MKGALQMDKINFKIAKSMVDDGFYLMHLRWLEFYDPSIIRENPDCSHFLAVAGKNWRDVRHRHALVLKEKKSG